MWFGGEYITEGFENSSHFQKKRQKRWWNAYLLIYEKVTFKISSHLFLSIFSRFCLYSLLK